MAIGSQAALEQSLRELSRGAADDIDTQLPPLDDDALPVAPDRSRPPLRARAVATLAQADSWVEAASVGPDRSHWASGALATRRLAISIAAVLALFGACLALDHVYFGRHDGSAWHRVLESAVLDARSALERGDANAAEQALARLDAQQAADPRVLALQQQAQRRQQDLAAHREQLQDAVRRASLALGFHAPALAAPEAERHDEPVRIVGAMAVVAPSEPPSPGACNEALVALSLCVR